MRGKVEVAGDFPNLSERSSLDHEMEPRYTPLLSQSPIAGQNDALLLNRQPFKLKPNLRVFNPEAVMNPFYLGGEERSPLSTDIAGLRTLYSREH